MKIMERIALGRTVWLVTAGVGLLILGALYTIFGTEASFAPALDKAKTSDAHVPAEGIAPIEEPNYSYEVSTVTFGGSCTAGSMLGSAAYGTFNGALAENGTGYFFENLSGIFASDGFTLAGLDVTLTDRELTPAEKESREWFCAPVSAAEVFAGIDALSLEFDRTMDYGTEGYADTQTALEAAGIHWCDTGRAVYRELESGVKIAVYCCELDADQAENVKSWLASAKEKADFTALYLSDTEETYMPSESKTALMQSYIDAGADLVVGTNGAKLQPSAEYGDGFIAYSLGSLIDGATRYHEDYTALLQVELQSKNGELTGVEYRFIPCYTADGDQSWRPTEIAGDNERENVLAFLRGERPRP